MHGFIVGNGQNTNTGGEGRCWKGLHLPETAVSLLFGAEGWMASESPPPAASGLGQDLTRTRFTLLRELCFGRRKGANPAGVATASVRVTSMLRVAC